MTFLTLHIDKITVYPYAALDQLVGPTLSACASHYSPLHGDSEYFVEESENSTN